MFCRIPHTAPQTTHETLPKVEQTWVPRTHSLSSSLCQCPSLQCGQDLNGHLSIIYDRRNGNPQS